MAIVVHRGHRLANQGAFPVKELDGENYIHRVNCEFAGYADHILNEKGVTCTPTYWSERDDWTLAMVAAGLGFAFMPINVVNHAGGRCIAGRRAGILATSGSYYRTRTTLFARGWRAGSGSDAKEMVWRQCDRGRCIS
jgi:DNA-binding transcriptional LysR family regulator